MKTLLELQTEATRGTLPLDKVHPIHEVVKIDYFMPGCPPSADAIWKVLTDLLAGKEPELGHGLMHYD